MLQDRRRECTAAEDAISIVNAVALESLRAGAQKNVPLRLAIDARVWKTGIGTYTRDLLSGLQRLGAEIRVRAIVRAEAEHTIAPLCDEAIVEDVPIYTVREQFQIPRAARGCDLLHVPHYNVPVLYRDPVVATIHDLTHLTAPAFRKSAKAWLYAWPMLQAAARKASLIITVSEHSKREISRRLGIRAEKIAVIHNGVGPRFRFRNRTEARARVQAALGIARPYLLYVGNLKPHKNVPALVRAFAKLRSRRGMDYLLVLGGDDQAHRNAVLSECAALGIRDAVLHVPWISEDLLPDVYAAADLLVMPSICEGFGLPVLEAMACGTPVVCSRAMALPEVAGDAALYIDPHDIEAMAAAIERVLCSPAVQAEMREKGFRQAAKFKWEESARKHVEVYQRVLGRSIGTNACRTCLS